MNTLVCTVLRRAWHETNAWLFVNTNNALNSWDNQSSAIAFEPTRKELSMFSRAGHSCFRADKVAKMELR